MHFVDEYVSLEQPEFFNEFLLKLSDSMTSHLQVLTILCRHQQQCLTYCSFYFCVTLINFSEIIILKFVPFFYKFFYTCSKIFYIATNSMICFLKPNQHFPVSFHEVGVDFI